MSKKHLIKFLIFAGLLVVLVAGLVWLKILKVPSNSSKTGVQTTPALTFFGSVLRIVPDGENITLDIAEIDTSSAAARGTKSFSVKSGNPGGFSSLISSSSALPKNYSTQFGDIQVGDVLSVTYSGNASPYPVISLRNDSATNNTRQPAYLSGSITEVTDTVLKIKTSSGNTYTLKVVGTCRIGPKYQIVEGKERPGTLKIMFDFSTLKVGDKVAVIYSRNEGEFIVPDNIMIL